MLAAASSVVVPPDNRSCIVETGDWCCIVEIVASLRELESTIERQNKPETQTKIIIIKRTKQLLTPHLLRGLRRAQRGCEAKNDIPNLPSAYSTKNSS